jgi:hypothetical protein
MKQIAPERLNRISDSLLYADIIQATEALLAIREHPKFKAWVPGYLKRKEIAELKLQVLLGEIIKRGLA